MNCFQLTRKGEKEPTDLQLVDEELCNVFGQPVDKKYWMPLFKVTEPERTCYNWYDIIGLGLACGRSFEFIKNTLGAQGEDDIGHKVCDYLDQNFTTNAWCERK